MFKTKKSLICMVVFMLIILLSSFCFAEDVEQINVDQAEEPVATEEEILEDTDLSYPSNVVENDLFLCAPTVNMDQLVSGNVYIMANTVNVTGQVAGNMYILANNVNFSQAYVQSSVYIVANSIKFEGITTDLYAKCITLDIPANFGVYRDLKVTAQNTSINGAIGRNAYITSSKLSLQKDDAKATIFGNLNYTSNSEIEIPEGSVEGNVNYSKYSTNGTPSTTVMGKVLKYVVIFFANFLTALLVYLISVFFAKNKVEKMTKILSVKYGLPALGIGLLAFIAIPFAIALLAISLIGIPVSLLFISLYGLLLAVSIPVLTVLFTNIIANHYHIDKKLPQVAIVFGTSVVLTALKYIPFVGGIFNFILVILGFGSMFTALFIKNFKTEKKEKTVKENTKKEDK